MVRCCAGASGSVVVHRVRGTKVVSVVATGKTEPARKVDITSMANGTIERVLVDVGDLVRR